MRFLELLQKNKTIIISPIVRVRSQIDLTA